MKKIKIFHEKSDVIEIFEDAESDKDTIAKTLAQLFSQTKISILSTTHATALVRPSKLNAIVIEDIQSEHIVQPTDQVKKSVGETKIKDKEPKKEEPEMDIITDVN